IATFLSTLERLPLLQPDQLSETTRLRGEFADARSLADELLRRGWLTAYQVRQLLENAGQDLVLGKYVLLEGLGEVGLGDALKVLRKDPLAHTEAVQRLRREARALPRVRHPSIVTLYDCDEAEGRHFLVMEYLPGTDLHALVREHGPLVVPLACEYVRQAA